MADTNKTDPFISALQDKLMSTSDMISSSNTGIEDKIGQAIQGVKDSNAASGARINSEGDRNFGFAVGQAAYQRGDVLDARSGFATNNAFLRNLDLNTEKSLKDMDMRKHELLLAGDAEAASKISELQLKSIEFKQNAFQQTFSNLLALGNFGLQENAQKNAQGNADRAFGLQERQMSFNEKQAIDNIALQFGIAPKPGDTIDTITARAAPFASERQKLELSKTRAEISKLNAETARAISDAKSSKTVESYNVDVLAAALLDPRGGSAILGGIKDTNIQGLVIAKANQIQNARFESYATEDANSGLSKKKSLERINADTTLSPADRVSAIAATGRAYAPFEAAAAKKKAEILSKPPSWFSNSHSK